MPLPDPWGTQLPHVKWVESMARAREEAGEDARFVEMGPGKVLCGLLRRIVPNAESRSLSTAADLHGFLEEMG